MLTFFSIIHVTLCVFMLFVILLQPGKDAGMGAALGGGAATSAFGGRGAVTFLGKVTAVCAAGFFLTSLGLSFVGLRTSVAEEVDEAPAGAVAPAAAPAEGGAKSVEQPAGEAPVAKDAPAEAAPAEKPAAPAPAPEGKPEGG